MYEMHSAHSCLTKIASILAENGDYHPDNMLDQYISDYQFVPKQVCPLPFNYIFFIFSSSLK